MDPWGVEFRTYRSQIKNLPDGISKLLYSITFPHHGKKTVVVKNKMAIVTASQIQDVPSELVESSCSTGYPEPIDQVLGNKLSNVWAQRQLIKGETGEMFETTETIIGGCNLFTSTGFKGLIIEIQDKVGPDGDETTEEAFKEKISGIEDLLRSINVTDYQLTTDCLDPANPNYLCDLAYQYVRVLE